jgi:sigma-B regulation protein RsbU (phosphoserine phosphatase)
VVGLFPDSVYQQETVQMYPGDILLIFTDGVIEAINLNGDELGEARLTALVTSHAELSAVELRDWLLFNIAEFVGPTPQRDDMTVVVAKVL